MLVHSPPLRRLALRAAAAAGAVAALLILAPALSSGGAGAQERAGDAPEPGSVDLPLVIPGPEPDLILLFTGMVSGYVEPCGCPKNPAGGIPRRAGYLGLLDREYPHAKILLLETGEFASDFNEPGLIKTSTYLDALEDLGYDVVAVGERELAGGLGAFHQMFGRRKLEVTSATYTERGGSKLLAEPYVIKEVKLAGGKTVRVGIISLHAHNSSLVAAGEGLTPVVSRDPAEQALRYVPELASRSDMVVLLAAMGLSDLRRVAEAVPGQIDLALGGWGDRLSPAGFDQVGGIPTFYAGDEGKRVGEVRIFLNDGKISEMKPFLIHLTERYPAEKKYQKIVDKMLVQVNETMKSLPPSVAQAIGASGSAKPGGQVRFLTATSCGRCHSGIYDAWLETDHSRAMATLRQANQDFNPDCVKCHSTAFRVPGGFISMNASPELANVQCEACHGSGEEHVKSPGDPYGSVAPRTCYSCHTKENSPDFSFFKYWAIVKH